jgi:tRNA (cmo5U34)-methyltransferase
MNDPLTNKYVDPEHALAYLARADSLPHRTEGEATLLELLPPAPRRVLDLGAGDGRLLALVKLARPDAAGVALDFSPTMLDAVRKRFVDAGDLTVVAHNLSYPLPDLGAFDCIVSSFAIHHLFDERKRELYAEIFQSLTPGGVFCNLEHVASPTPELHEAFFRATGKTPAGEDPDNKLVSLDLQLNWLREIGFVDVDCFWKWREYALFAGWKPE